MRRVIATGRRMGKSTVSLEYAMLQEQAEAMQKSIDKMIIDEIWNSAQYRVHRSFITRKGQRRHILGVNTEIMEWLMNEQNQFGRKNPEWTISDGKINMSDKLYTLLILKFGEPY